MKPIGACTLIVFSALLSFNHVAVADDKQDTLAEACAIEYLACMQQAERDFRVCEITARINSQHTTQCEGYYSSGYGCFSHITPHRHIAFELGDAECRKKAAKARQDCGNQLDECLNCID